MSQSGSGPAGSTRAKTAALPAQSPVAAAQEGDEPSEESEDVKTALGAVSIEERQRSLRLALAEADKQLAMIQIQKDEELLRDKQAAIAAAQQHPSMATLPFSASTPPGGAPSTPVRAKPPVARELLAQMLLSGGNSTALPRRGISSYASLVQEASIEALPPATPLSVTPVVASAAAGAAQTAKIRLPVPAKFTGEDETQCARVDSWIAELQLWLDLQLLPAEQHHRYAATFMTGAAMQWYQQKADEVARSGRQMTWAWLQAQLIQDYGSGSSKEAMAVEWENLRMGVYAADGSSTGGKATRTVKGYTDLFVRYMRQLTEYNQQTDNLLVIQRYVKGIRDGYCALYDVMRGPDLLVMYRSLSDAIMAAQTAESQMTSSKSYKPAAQSSSAPSLRSEQRSSAYRAAKQVNNLQEGKLSDSAEGESGLAQQEGQQHLRAYGFTYRPSPKDGRHPLTKAEAQMLYDERRCFRCHELHPVGHGQPLCKRPVAKTAPRPLNA